MGKCMPKTDRELVINGYVPAGMTLKQTFVTRNYLKKHGFNLKPMAFNMKDARMKSTENPWKPSEDIMIFGKEIEIPDGRTESECIARRQWLQENFVDVGWGSEIGKHVIDWNI